MNKYGVVLDDFGMESMLNNFMDEFISPISKSEWSSCMNTSEILNAGINFDPLKKISFAVFFPEVGGNTLDTHHGFVLEYGIDRDVDLG